MDFDELAGKYNGLQKTKTDRKTVLLKACLDILKKCYDSGYVLNFFEQTAIWDNVECDGYCLMEEIKDILDGLE